MTMLSMYSECCEVKADLKDYAQAVIQYCMMNYLHFIGFYNLIEIDCISKFSKSYDLLSNTSSWWFHVCTFASITCSKGWLICSS